MISNLRLNRRELARRKRKKNQAMACGVLLAAALLTFVCLPYFPGGRGWAPRPATQALLGSEEGVGTASGVMTAPHPDRDSRTEGETEAEPGDEPGPESGVEPGANTGPSKRTDADGIAVVRVDSALSEDKPAPDDALEGIAYYVESNSIVPIHAQASDASAIIGSANPGALVYGYRFDDAWVCVADIEGNAYYVKSEHVTPFTRALSEISLFQNHGEVVSGGFTLNTNVHSISGLTLEEITHLLRRHPGLQGIEETVLLHEKKYGVNAYFILGVASQESGYGTSPLATKKKNLFGIGAYDGDAYESALAFASTSESVEYFCLLISRYRENGRTTPEAINVRYASDELWASRVVQLMNSYAMQNESN